jgi:hypothetical protein
LLAQLIIAALADYARVTGRDLSQNSFAATLELSNSPEAVLQLLQGREKAFEGCDDDNRRLITSLKPVVVIVHGFSGILCEAVSLVSVVYHPADLLT